MTCWPPGWSTSRPPARAKATVRSYEAGVALFLLLPHQGGVARRADQAPRDGLAGLHERVPARRRVEIRLMAIKRFASLVGRRGELRRRRHPGHPSRRSWTSGPSPVCPRTSCSGLLKACGGADLRDKRDKAMVVLFAETGMRASELFGLTVDDLDLSTGRSARRPWQGWARPAGEVLGHVLPPPLDRYLRARRAAGKPGDRGPLWVGRGRSAALQRAWSTR